MSKETWVYNIVAMMATRNSDDPITDLIIGDDSVEYDLFFGYDEEKVMDSIIASGYERRYVYRIFIEAKPERMLGAGNEQPDNEAPE